LRHHVLELFADSSRHKDDKEKEEEDEHSKDLDHQPPVGCDRLEILQDFVMAQLNIESSVVNVVVNPGDHLLLLLHHGGELAEDASKLDDGALDGVHSIRPAGVVLVLIVVDGGEL